MEVNRLWVFGYGSLCWQPGFEYGNKMLGFVRGFSRRFWQGNTHHRGTTEKPGRVATLIEDDEGVTWGMAFELVGEAALKYLEQRECSLGGYQTLFTHFFSRNGTHEPFPVLLYVATPDNAQWLGPAPLNEVAVQIAECRGNAGHNVEYVVRLADFIREHLPEVHDEHLFTLEVLVLQRLQEMNVSVDQLVVMKTETVEKTACERSANNSAEDRAVVENAAERRNSFQYQANLGPKKLLCVKV